MSHDQILGRYRLTSLLGEGGMGKVYKAFDATLERNVAIKILPPELLTDSARVTRFMQEARAASALNHPHVMAVYDIGEHDGVRYIAMELIDGKTLRDIIAAGPLDIRKTVKLVLQVAEALTAAHAVGIVHRDLKPENIMVTSGGYAKVLDFGLAKLRVSEEGTAEVSRTLPKATAPGMVMGTVGYMAPEQARGNAVDHRVDLFSLGCILYELLTGCRAFHGDSSVDTLHKILHTEPEPLRSLRPDVPPELQRIVRKALEKDTDERYQSAKDLAIDLRQLQRDIDSNPSSASAAVPTIAPRARWVWPAALVIAIAFILVLVLRPRPTTAPGGQPQAMRITRVTATGKVIAGAISTDGKFVTYVVSDRGEQALWVRQMASGQSLQLAPPSRDAYWGVAFAPDGSIYYGLKSPTAPAGTIFQISPLGGTPRRIISEIDSQPTFAPDGKRLAFLRTRFPKPDESAVIVANVDGTEPRTLAVVRSPEFFVPIFFAGASWSPDGKLIATSVLNQQEIIGRIVGIDVQSGAMKTIAANDWPSVAQVAWMPDQKGLIAIAPARREGGGPSAMRAAPTAVNQVWYVPYPSGKPSLITNDLFDYRSVSLTADGKSLLTIASDASSDVWIHEDAKPPKRITAGRQEGTFGIAPLADGRFVFTSLETGKVDIWIMNADGGGRTLLTRDPYENRGPVLTPDGRTIVYLSSTSKQIEICRMNLDGSERRALATGLANSTVSVSPDGQWVAYEAIEMGSSGVASVPFIARIPIEGGKPVRLTDYWAIIPSYSPDGTRIAVYCQETPKSQYTLGVIPAEGGRPLKTIYFSASFVRSGIGWSADRRSLIVNTAPSDRANLWRVPIDGSPPQRLTNFDEHIIMAFAPLRAGKGWILSRGELSRDAVLITGFRP